MKHPPSCGCSLEFFVYMFYNWPYFLELYQIGLRPPKANLTGAGFYAPDAFFVATTAISLKPKLLPVLCDLGW